MKTAEAVEFLTKKLKRDSLFRQSYQATISLCFSDEHLDWQKKHKGKQITRKAIIEISNKAADKFLDLWCGK